MNRTEVFKLFIGWRDELAESGFRPCEIDGSPIPPTMPASVGSFFLPSNEQIERWLDACLAKRKLRIIKRPRPNSSDEVSVLFERLRWHKVLAGSGGSLWAVFGSRHLLSDETTWQQIDTFALLMGIACGVASSNTDKWSDLLGLSS